MQNKKRGVIRTKFAYAIIFILTFSFLSPQPSFAAPLSNLTHASGNAMASATGNQTISFTTTTSAPIKSIAIRFSTSENGTAKPAGLNLANAAIASTTGLSGQWNLNIAAESGQLTLARDIAESLPADTMISIGLANITNHAIGDCDSGAGLMDTCYVYIATYADDGVTRIDEGSTTFTAYEDPYFDFEIKGVPTGATRHGTTTTRPSSDKELALGNLPQNEAVYVTQEISVTTNAPNGYQVSVYLEDLPTGTNPANTIDSFAGLNATWNAPKPWETPSGINAGSHTGWIGINTSDNQAGTQWQDGEGLFAPLSIVPRVIMKSDEDERAGKVIYVTYAVEANAHHTADTYTGRINYHVETYY